MNKKIDFVIDFDGTCVLHKYPNVGEPVDNCVEVLNKIIVSGNNIILNTMRSGKTLEDAVNWFKSYGLTLYGINEHPTQKKWTTSPKCHGDIFIDDRAFGCPVRMQDNYRVVDWFVIEKELFIK